MAKSEKGVEKGVAKLPIEIKYKILGYMNKPQPRELLADIISYISSYRKCRHLYYSIYVEEWDESVEESMNWFANDLESFANDHYPGVLGFREEFFEIWRRNFHMRTWSNGRIIQHISYLNGKPSSRYIGEFFPLLTPEERNLFLEGRLCNYIT
jgi:hypothetical protein